MNLVLITPSAFLIQCVFSIYFCSQLFRLLGGKLFHSQLHSAPKSALVSHKQVCLLEFDQRPNHTSSDSLSVSLAEEQYTLLCSLLPREINPILPIPATAMLKEPNRCQRRRVCCCEKVDSFLWSEPRYFAFIKFCFELLCVKYYNFWSLNR